MKAVIFDMDGVIIDSEPLKFQAYEKVFSSEFGVKINFSDWLFGAHEPVEMQHFLDIHNLQSNVDDLIKKKREVYNLLLREINLVPGIVEFIQKLKQAGFVLGLATSSNRTSTDIVLDKFDMSKYFDSVLTEGEIEKKKPDPDIYLKSADHLGVLPENCAVVEDSPTGVEAGKLAGMKVIALTTSVASADLAEADKIVGSFSELKIEEIIKW